MALDDAAAQFLFFVKICFNVSCHQDEVGCLDLDYLCAIAQLVVWPFGPGLDWPTAGVH